MSVQKRSDNSQHRNASISLDINDEGDSLSFALASNQINQSSTDNYNAYEKFQEPPKSDKIFIEGDNKEIEESRHGKEDGFKDQWSQRDKESRAKILKSEKESSLLAESNQEIPQIRDLSIIDIGSLFNQFEIIENPEAYQDEKEVESKQESLSISEVLPADQEQFVDSSLFFILNEIIGAFSNMPGHKVIEEGDLLSGQKRYDEAARKYEIAAEKKISKLTEVFLKLGVARLRQKKDQETVETFERRNESSQIGQYFGGIQHEMEEIHYKDLSFSILCKYLPGLLHDFHNL